MEESFIISRKQEKIKQKMTYTSSIDDLGVTSNARLAEAASRRQRKSIRRLMTDERRSGIVGKAR